MTDAPERIWACVDKDTKSGVVALLGDATFQAAGWRDDQPRFISVRRSNKGEERAYNSSC